ncbi:MAG: 4Fe-4S dicluster domain-containing protein [bacterium]
MNRREFLKTGAIGLGGLVGIKGSVYPSETKEFYGMLVDTTLCIGCSSCEKACAEVNHLPAPNLGDDKPRETSIDAFTVVNKFKIDNKEIFVKKQCMHCNQPACASACLVKAMHKTEEGPVIWRGNKCLGCRYCMIACPFDIPKLEYNSLNPKIRKCEFCFERLKKGEKPGCVDACPMEALIFGTRRELIEIARTRIYKNPEKYVHHIYGEDEAGGTGWLYLASVPFQKLGFGANIGTTPYPEYTKEFLYSVALIFLVWPSFLVGLHKALKKEDEGD